MGSVHARGDTFLTFGLKALTETNTSRLATALHAFVNRLVFLNFHGEKIRSIPGSYKNVISFLEAKQKTANTFPNPKQFQTTVGNG
jgi:hypothetical protein